MKSILLFLSFSAGIAVSDAQFTGIIGMLCIRPEFVENRTEAQSDRQCAYFCSESLRCQAFSMADGFCKMFVFDKCSKNVRDCSCTRTGQLFVKKQPGLPAGSMCPSGFVDENCGIKYKKYSGIKSWDIYKSTVEAESGLVADVIDTNELIYLRSFFSKYSINIAFLGGRQLAGSLEPAGGWKWSSCNIDIGSSMWKSGEPNNQGGTECVTVAGTAQSLLTDGDLSYSGMWGGIGECVSPFD